MTEWDDSSWQHIDDAVSRLEDCWRATGSAILADYVPPCDHPLRKRTLVALIPVDQEYRWKPGERKKLEDYLSEWPELTADHGSLVNLLAAECYLRATLGLHATIEELKERFPEVWQRIDLHAIAAKVENEESSDPNDRESPMDADQPTIPYSKDPPPQEPPPSLPDGERYGRYVIRRFLARGGMAEVYLAEDEELRWEVALKLPLPERFQSQDDLQPFLDEVRSAIRLRHPRIVPVHYVDRAADGRPYVIMDYIEGGSLKDLLDSHKSKHTKLPFSRTANLLIEVSETLHHAHQQRFVHRDLKPGNILLDRDGRPFVSDFGFALHEDVQSQKVGEIAGTPEYMSPEQVRGEAHWLDGRTDIWALGAVLYELMTGRRPFTGIDFHEIANGILHREPKPPRQIDDGIPAELERICLKCLSKRIEGRYPTAVSLADELRQWLHEAKIKQKPHFTCQFPSCGRAVRIEETFYCSSCQGWMCRRHRDGELPAYCAQCAEAVREEWFGTAIKKVASPAVANATITALLGITQPQPPFKARVWTERAGVATTRDIVSVPRDSKGVYRIGERFSLRVQAERDCYLALFDVGTSGKISLLLQGYRIPAGSPVSLSGPDENHEWLVGGPAGIERIKALFAIAPFDFQPVVRECGAQATVLGFANVTADICKLGLVFEEMPKESWADALCHFVVESL